jgi:hypothetical protein
MAEIRIVEELCELIETVDVAPDELAMVVANGFGRAWIPNGQEVFYGSEDEEIALRLTYAKAGRLVAAVAGPALTNEAARALIDQVRALAAGGEPKLWRSTQFSTVPLEGYWRYRDEWQIRPVPQDAPRPPQLYAPHPFVLEAHGSMVSHPFVGGMQAQKRVSEIRLLLSLVLQGGLQEAGIRHHAWFIQREPEFHSTFAQVGYYFPPARWPADAFSPVDELEVVTEVPADEYYQRLGISYDRPLEVPDVLRPLADAFREATEPDRERFLRAAYWFDRASSAWYVSASLSYISVINAIEVLTENGAPDPCPTCGLNRAPGPTARFRETVERFAGDVPERDELYRLRSRLVHGDHLLLADGPSGFSFMPYPASERGRQDLALRVSRVVIMAWLFAAAQGDLENSRGR